MKPYWFSFANAMFEVAMQDLYLNQYHLLNLSLKKAHGIHSFYMYLVRVDAPY
jgi:hypothetical protein